MSYLYRQSDAGPSAWANAAPFVGDNPSAGDEDHGDSTSELGKRKLKSVNRGAQACSECRKQKIRCFPALDDPDHDRPCKRCQERKLFCHFPAHHRGRKKIRQSSSTSTSAPARNLKYLPEDAILPRQDDGPVSPLPITDDFQVSRYHFLAPSGPGVSNIRETHPSQGHRLSLRQMVDHPNRWNQHDHQPAHSPVESLLGGGHRGGESQGAGNPVQQGIITETEAVSLYSLFMQHFNPAVHLLDPSIYTHEYTKTHNTFLYTAILCVTSRYLNTSAIRLHGSPNTIGPDSYESRHQQILLLANDHLVWAFAEAKRELEVVQAMLTLAIWKEPHEERAPFFFNRAVLLGKELRLGRIYTNEEIKRMSAVDKQWTRQRQRTWLCLFNLNTIWYMQFAQPMLIEPSDPLVATSRHWLTRSSAATYHLDMRQVCSADLRRKYIHYRELLGPSTVGSDVKPNLSPLSLSILARTINEDLRTSADAWCEELEEANISLPKVRMWSESLRLNLNIILVNTTLRLPVEHQLARKSSETTPSNRLSSLTSFHHCLSSATSVLDNFVHMDPEQLSFATDTLLHFALYAATLLWTLCRNPTTCAFEEAEIAHCKQLILGTAEVLAKASMYRNDSPQLHALYLHRLCDRDRRPPASHVPRPDPGPVGIAPSALFQDNVPLLPDQIALSPWLFNTFDGSAGTFNPVSINTGIGFEGGMDFMTDFDQLLSDFGMELKGTNIHGQGIA